MPAQLVALTDGRVIQIDKGILVIGRHVECDVQILSPKVSRLHCCIAQVGDYLVVRDLNSTNGIRINGVRVMEGRLGADDELAIGTHRYRVRGDGLAARAAVQQPGPDQLAAERAAKVAARKDLDSCEEPIALPEPAARPPKKNSRDSALQPIPIREVSSLGQTEPPVALPADEPPPPVLEEEPPAAPPLPNPWEAISGGEEVPNPSRQ